MRFALATGLLAVCLGVVVPAPKAALSPGPRIWVATGTVFTVHGSGFAPHRRVTVTVTTSQTTLRRIVIATASGAVAVRFVSVSAAKCGVAAVVARQTPTGRVATWKPPREMCGTYPSGPGA